jgi:hypothetical protein
MININEKIPDIYTDAEMLEVLTLFSEALDAADDAVGVAAVALDYPESEEYEKLQEWQEFVRFFMGRVAAKVNGEADREVTV